MTERGTSVAKLTIGLTGTASVGAGCWLLSPPAALIVVGLILIASVIGKK